MSKGYFVKMQFIQKLTFKMMVEVFGVHEQHTTLDNILTVSGTFPEIPSEEYIKEIERLYVEEFNKKDSEFYALSCKFDCFKEVKVVDLDTFNSGN